MRDFGLLSVKRPPLNRSSWFSDFGRTSPWTTLPRTALSPTAKSVTGCWESINCRVHPRQQQSRTSHYQPPTEKLRISARLLEPEIRNFDGVSVDCKMVVLR